MARKAELLDVVGDLYDCAIAPQRWPSALERLAGALDCPGASITLQDPRRHQVRVLSTWGFAPEFQEALHRAQPINPLLPFGWFAQVDEVFTGVGILGREEYYKTRFFREVLQPHGYCDAAISAFAKTSNRYGGLTIPHLLKQGEFDSEKLDDVRTIAPHVRRAVMIGDLLDSRALQQDMLSATLDLLTVGIVLVDAKARIVHANLAAMRHLETKSALRSHAGILSARDPRSDKGLHDAITSAASGTRIDVPKSGITVAVSAAQGADLAAWVLPLDNGLRGELAAPFSAAAAVFIRELGDSSAFPGELFVKRFGITPAECRVLMLLVQGMSIAETCDVLGVSEPTVKTHLSRLFAKTETSGQADLMRLAMSALAPAKAGRE